MFTYDLSATVVAHAGDVNGDGQVSLLDYNVIKANFGNAYESGNHWGDGDVNGDHQVGLLDFNIVKAHFGHTTGDGAAVTAVPEPATISLLALAGLAALRRKQ
ncbi:MAG: dockerin type I domain-containing protein [Planctomycetota bacterium]|nr:dockerin type I domain-containing protein [Planctomycetota bacterium]